MTFRHRGNSSTFRSFSMGVCALAAVSASWAQDASMQSEELEVIVVTAQRRSESLQSVPIQVAAFSAADIEDAGIKSTGDFVALVPNVSFDESSTYLSSAIAVRGVSQIFGGDSPVAFVIDGVPQNSHLQQKMKLFDVERIEVLKGPQGGIYGRNAIGGAINIITKAPSDHLEGFLESSYGRGDALDVTAGVSTPVGDSAGLRLSGSYNTDDGRIRNVYRGDNADAINHDWELRGKMTAELADTINVDLRAAYRDFDAAANSVSVVPSARADDYQPPRSNLGGISVGDIFDASGKIDIDLGGVTLTSISAYTELEENFRSDADLSNLVDNPGGFLDLGFGLAFGIDSLTKQTSQEIRLVSDAEAPFRWILGAYYLDASRLNTNYAWVDTDGTFDHIHDPALQLQKSPESNENSAYAGYLTLDYDIGDHLTLSGAFRYDHDHRRQLNLTTGAVRTKDFSSPQPKATVTYKFTPERMVYATYSKG